MRVEINVGFPYPATGGNMAIKNRKTNLRLPLRKRVDSVVERLNAASINSAPGAVELPNELFDDMADVIEELEVLVYGPRIK